MTSLIQLWCILLYLDCWRPGVPNPRFPPGPPPPLIPCNVQEPRELDRQLLMIFEMNLAIVIQFGIEFPHNGNQAWELRIPLSISTAMSSNSSAANSSGPDFSPSVVLATLVGYLGADAWWTSDLALSLWPERLLQFPASLS
jgi:hypothetical protein